MKTIKYLALAAIVLSTATSCEKALEPYSNPDCYLNFRFIDSEGNDYQNEDIAKIPSIASTPILYNFKTHGNVQSDTVWIAAKTAGFVKDYDRSYDLEQVQIEGAQNAVPGVDYVAFDSQEAKNAQVVKAGETLFKVPVIVLRSSTLQTKDVLLKVRFKENQNFKNGFTMMQERIISFTDRLSKPTVWDQCGLDDIFGEYGDVKYQLMIDWSGKPWSDEFILDNYNKDKAYLSYMAQVFQKRLEEENEVRQAEGLDIWREADGTPIIFKPLPKE
jgi:hypothetical protein